MKALIEPSGRVAEVVETPFPVHPDFKWVDVLEGVDVKADWTYVDGVFVKPPEPTEQISV